MRCTACGQANATGMRYCGMCGRPLGEYAGERERRRVSVLFVDLTGFSGATHDLDPEELRDLADEMLTAVASVIEDYDGYVDAFRGDGLLAVFGAPRSHPDDPYRAVVAAEASLRAIERVSRNKDIDMQGRAGVATGVVIAGALGSGRVREYTVMGSTVNLASRLEHAAGPGEVWTTEATFQATRHRLTFETVTDLQLAGFPNVTEAFKLVSHERREVDPYAQLRLVGRLAELEKLERRRSEVERDGQAGVLWLVGEAGSGKSRLLRGFAGRVPEGSRVLWLNQQDGRSFGWNALADQLFELSEAEDPRSRHTHVAERLAELLPGEERWHQEILSSLDLAPDTPYRRLERRNVDRRLLAWRDLLAALPQRQAGLRSLVLISDSDRFDPMLGDFIGLLAEVASPILVLRSSRGRYLPGGVSALTLAPLSLPESLELLEQVADPVFGAAARALVQQVGGVPASVLELGRTLSVTQDAHVGGSLTSLVQARLDMLDPRARRLLAVAAAVGERSWEGLLRNLMPEARSDLRLLRRSELLLREASSSLPGEVEYRFRSELLRRAALQMAPFAERPPVHLRIATWLEQTAPLSFSELTAEHFERAGAPEAAFAHYLAAAAEAEADFDTLHADHLYQHLSSLPLPPELRAQGLLAYAQAASARGAAALALQQLERARDALAGCESEACGQLRSSEQRLREELEAGLIGAVKEV